MLLRSTSFFLSAIQHLVVPPLVALSALFNGHCPDDCEQFKLFMNCCDCCCLFCLLKVQKKIQRDWCFAMKCISTIVFYHFVPCHSCFILNSIQLRYWLHVFLYLNVSKVRINRKIKTNITNYYYYTTPRYELYILIFCTQPFLSIQQNQCKKREFVLFPPSIHYLPRMKRACCIHSSSILQTNVQVSLTSECVWNRQAFSISKNALASCIKKSNYSQWFECFKFGRQKCYKPRSFNITLTNRERVQMLQICEYNISNDLWHHTDGFARRIEQKR